MRSARSVVAVLGAFGLLGCQSILDDLARIDPCDDASQGTLGPTWSIEGEGSREGCRASRYEGEFELDSPVPIPVTYSAPPATRDGGTGPAPTRTIHAAATGFTLAGTQRGRCVAFRTEEMVDGERVTYEFNGKIAGTTLSGEFTGGGPSNCSVRGTFTLR